MKAIYLLSGLGADKRVFDFIDFAEFKVIHIYWITPLGNESIESYARRLTNQIKTVKPTLLGVSFGGLLAIEIAKQIETEKVILISSAKTKFDIPFYFRAAGQLKLIKIIPARILKTVNSLTFWFFGAVTEKEKDLLRTIITETDSKFLKWAVEKIVNWKNISELPTLTHIHGTDDKILPLRTANYKIANGGHLMIISKGAELSKLIHKILE